MRPLRNISTKTSKKAPFSFSRNVSSHQNQQYAPQFFNPSYISPKELARLDEVGFKHNSSSSNKKSSKSIFQYVTPALSVTKNYVIFDTSNNTNKDNSGLNQNLLSSSKQIPNYALNEEFERILLKKSNHISNKNSHVNISIGSISNNHTTLNIRRVNSNNIKQVSIPNKLLRRAFSSSPQNSNSSSSSKSNSDSIHDLESKLSKLKIRNLDSSNNKYIEEFKKFPNIDDAFDHMSENPLKIQEFTIDNLMNQNKFNEVLPVFNRMRNNGLVPTLPIYNKVLKSIPLRQTNESLENNMTHLLNIYSDLLSNNIKPNMETYEIVIGSLVNSSLISYSQLNYRNGFEFFKISLELFLINIDSKDFEFHNNLIYVNLIKCLNYFQIKDAISPMDLLNKLESRISDDNKLEFYLQLTKLSAIFKDEELVESIFNNQIKPLKLLSNHDEIYQTLIQSYNLCNNFKKSSLLLDTIINNLPNKESAESQDLIRDYLSVFIRSQSLINPSDAFKMVHQFSKIDWLPKLSIESLTTLAYSFLKLGDLQMTLKIWDFMVIRNDFINEFNKYNNNEFQILISNFSNHFFEKILFTNNKNLILKVVREFLGKNCLKFDDNLLVNYLRYLQNLNSQESDDLIIKLILNQGYKKILETNYNTNSSVDSKDSLSNYLSLIVDFIPNTITLKIFNSKLFKRIVEEYRLTRDNIYGIMKVFNVVFNNPNDEFDNLLKYYSKVLDLEFNDTENCYVEIPVEIENFKHQLQQYK